MEMSWVSEGEVLARARRAQEAWGSVPVAARLKVVRRLRHRLARDTEAACEVLGASRPVAPAELLSSEIIPLLDGCQFLETQASRLLAPRTASRTGTPGWLQGVYLRVHRDPLGVVLILGPSNYPFFLPGIQALQALVAGNAVLLKPGVGGTAAAAYLARLLVQAGLPELLLQVLPEEPEAGRELLRRGVDKLVLTGSAHTGRQVLSLAGETLTGAVAELSGYDAVFVGPGADLKVVADGLAFGLRLNRGRTCVAPRRVFLRTELVPELERLLAERLADAEPEELGPCELVAEVLDEGGRLVWGERGDDGFRGPVVLAEVPPRCRLFEEAPFLPILSLLPVEDDRECLEAAACSPFALGASLFGERAWAESMAGKVPAGVVVVNDMIAPTAHPAAPFAGRGCSGFGATRGAEGLLEMTTPRSVLIRQAGARYHFDKPDASDLPILAHYAMAAHGERWWERVLGLGRMIATVAGVRIRRRRERRRNKN